MPEPRRTPRPWPECVEPTPEQLADWLLVCGPEERLRFARHALIVTRDSMRCLVEHHDGRPARPPLLPDPVVPSQ